MGVIFTKILIIFLVVVIGFIANRIGKIPTEANPYLINILLDITTPCMILSSIISNTLTPETLQVTIEVVIGTVLFFIAEWPIAWLITKALRYDPKEDRGVLIVIISAVNTGFMGFPVTKTLFGSEFFFYMAMENIVLGIYLYFLTVLQMNYGTGRGPDLKAGFKAMCNNCMLFSVIGVVMLCFGWKLPEQGMDFLNLIGDATVPLSMLVVGVQLGDSNIRELFRNRKLLIVCLVNVILMPALTLLAVHWLPITAKGKLILVFAAAFPCAVVTVAMANREKKNATLMAEGVALTTLLSMFTLPVWAMIVMALYQ